MIVASCGTNLLLVLYVFECEYSEGCVRLLGGVQIVRVVRAVRVDVGAGVLIMVNEAH